MQDIIERMRATPLVFDGAMGTMIYAKGVFINTCYDELCLSRPALVREIHEEYLAAGADVIETNSFGANRIRLGEFGLADSVEAINAAAARLAREVAGDSRYVAASVGPCLKSAQLWQPERADELSAAYEQQLAPLVAGGIDLILLETFVHLDELRAAAAVARRTGVPVLASFTTRAGAETALGGSAEAMAAALDADPNVDAIGINCGVGPSDAYESVERILGIIGKPLLVMPNAGMPREVGGRMLYLSSPEYFTSYAKRFIALGARAVGGCCGTTPEHIRMAAKAIKSLSGVKRHVEIRVYEPSDNGAPVVPTSEKSALAKAMNAGRKVTSVEILPPKSCDIAAFIERARTCHAHGIDAINIPDGPRASARVSPMVASAAVLQRVGIEPILHYCCRDRNLIGMQSDLLGAQVAGVRNILIITGDPPKLGDYPDATGVFDVDSIGLTRVARNLNHGRDIGGSPVSPPTAIFIGVGANPCAVSRELEITRYYAKLDAGAEFAITQPIFDPDALFRFLDDVESYPRAVPVMAGVWPLMSYKNAEFMRNEVPGVEVPDAVMERMSRCTTKEDGIRTGIELAREICERIAPRVAGFQVSAPFGKVDIALSVLGRMD